MDSRGSSDPADELRGVVMDVPPDPVGELDFLALPARPGVAVFEDQEGRALLIAAGADVRELARRRLSGITADDRLDRPRTDHRAVTRRVEAFAAGSALEAEVLYLVHARRRLPEVHRTVRERWRAWYVHVDPDAEHPQWTRTSLEDGPAPGRGRLLGPLPDRESASRLIECVIDAFDLCRDHSLLVQAPCARACAYKEMARCPAPCDGSEPMPSYRARVGRAADIIARGAAGMAAAIEADMRAAAAGMRFEEAATLKRQHERIAALSGPAFAHVGDARRWRMAVVLPTARRRCVRVLGFDGRELSVVGELEGAADAARAAAHLAALPARGAIGESDAAGVLSRWLYSPSTRRRGAGIRLSDEMTVPQIEAALASAAIGVRRQPPAEVREQELGDAGAG